MAIRGEEEERATSAIVGCDYVSVPVDRLEEAQFCQKDAALAEVLKEVLGSLPQSRIGGGARDPLVDTQAKLQKLIDGLERGKMGGA